MPTASRFALIAALAVGSALALGFWWLGPVGGPSFADRVDLAEPVGRRERSPELVAPPLTGHRDEFKIGDEVNEHEAESIAAQSHAAEDPDAPEPLSLRVRLLDGQGRPIVARSSRIDALADNGAARTSDVVKGDAHELRGLVPGHWRIDGWALGFQNGTIDVELSRTDAAQERDLVLLERDSVRILLETNGRPIPEAFHLRPDAIATRDRRAGFISERLDDQGRILCGHVSPRDQAGLDERYLGLLVLECERPLWVHLTIGGTILESQYLTSGIEELKFSLPEAAPEELSAELILRPVDETTGEPILGALLDLTTGPRSRMVSVFSGPPVRFSNVPPGILDLSVRASGYEDVSFEIKLLPGASRNLGDVPVPSARTGELRILWTAGGSVESATVHWARTAERWPGGSFPFSNSAPANQGEELVITVAPGRWTVWCEATLDGTELASRPVEVEVAPAALRLSLRVEPLARLVLMPGAEKGQVMIVDPAVGRSTATLHEIESRPVTLDLPVGTWQLEFTSAGGVTTQEVLNLGPQGAVIQIGP